MASWILSGILMGAASATGMEIISGIVSLLGIFNTSVQGISNVSRIIRTNPDCKDIRAILDDDLLLEVRVRVLGHFITELKEIKFSYRTKEILEVIIPNINTCINNIQKQMTSINEKIAYNNSLWIFKKWRRHRFMEDENILRDLSSKLETLESRFYKVIELDPNYIKYKIDRGAGFISVDKERLAKSDYLSSQLFGKELDN